MADNRSAVDVVRESKMLAYTVGAVTLAAGIVLLFWPDRTITVVARLAGLLLLIAGIGDLIETVRNHRGMSYWGLLLLRAVINIGFGAVLLFWPGPTVGVLVWLVGLDLVIAGALGLLVRGQMAPEYQRGTTTRSIVTIIFGIVIMVWPHATVNVVAFVVGAVLVLTGLVFLWTGRQVSKVKVEVIDI
ncbi:HdeD family acid-resistance protein [Aquihabitans sp. McL0605]|uniref:HdeD family acid-resistance protein n=1 Tax=Aquihabitans sp. McL0605 TaxID=3415671 RepID=UPI003CE6B30C